MWMPIRLWDSPRDRFQCFQAPEPSCSPIDDVYVCIVLVFYNKVGLSPGMEKGFLPVKFPVMGMSWPLISLPFTKPKMSVTGFSHGQNLNAYYHNNAYPQNAKHVVWKATGSEFSPSFRAFHLPFLASQEYDISIVDSNETYNQPRDPISKLPAEIFDLIFSLLSPLALEAARVTCRGWRLKITNRKWILKSILSLIGGRRDALQYRDVIPNCTHLADDQLATFLNIHDMRYQIRSSVEDSSTGRVPFRIMTSQFSLSHIISQGDYEKSSKHTFTSAYINIAPSISFITFRLVCHSEDGQIDHAADILVLYRWDPAYKPEYAGFVHVDDLEGPLDVQLTESKPNESWILHVRSMQSNSSEAALYSISAKKAFSKQDSRFVIEPRAVCQTTRRSLASNEKQILGSTEILDPLILNRALPAFEGDWKLLAKIDFKIDVSTRNPIGKIILC